MSQYMTLFAKEADFGVRYWASISNVKQSSDKKSKKPKYISASIPANLSDDAKKLFRKHAEDTSNDEVHMLHVEVRDSWLKAVEGRDGDFVVLFVNKIVLPASKEDEE